MTTGKLIKTGKAIAIAIMVIGMIHDIATFTPLIRGGLSCLTPSNARVITYMSLVCGTAFILSGMLLFMLLPKLEQHKFLISSVTLIGAFLFLGGTLSVLFMLTNPFAWIAFILCTVEFAVILLIRKGINEQ